MESVKLCPACGAGNPPHAFFCEADGPGGRCGVPIADQPVVTREARVPQAKDEAGAGPGPRTTSRAWIVLPSGGRIDVTDGMVLGRAEEVCPDARLLTPPPHDFETPRRDLRRVRRVPDSGSRVDKRHLRERHADRSGDRSCDCGRISDRALARDRGPVRN